MAQQVAQHKAKELHSNWLYIISTAAAWILGWLLVVAVLELVLTFLQPAIANRWLTLLQHNWLVVIFKLHAGFREVQPSLLSRVNLLDLVILVLTAAMYVGLYTALRNTSKVWSCMALAQPILGIVLFLATKSAGRSSVMGAELVISLVMMTSKVFNKRIAYVGVLSSILLLVGDLGVSMAPSLILAVVTGTGYLLFVIWLWLVGRRLIQPHQENEVE